MFLFNFKCAFQASLGRVFARVSRIWRIQRLSSAQKYAKIYKAERHFESIVTFFQSSSLNPRVTSLLRQVQILKSWNNRLCLFLSTFRYRYAVSQCIESRLSKRRTLNRRINVHSISRSSLRPIQEGGADTSRGGTNQNIETTDVRRKVSRKRSADISPPEERELAKPASQGLWSMNLACLAATTKNSPRAASRNSAKCTAVALFKFHRVPVARTHTYVAVAVTFRSGPSNYNIRRSCSRDVTRKSRRDR